MALIGSIVIAMKAGTAAFQKQLAGVSKTLKKWANDTNVEGGKMAAKGFTALTAAATGAGAAMAGFAIATAKAIDDQDELAQRVGLNVQELRELEYATKLTGSEIEALGPALMKMNNNLSDAARGVPAATEAFARLGLKADDLMKMDTKQRFLTIAGAMSKLGDVADMTASSMDIFGKGGVGLLNTLGAGPEKLDALQAEFRKLRGVLTPDDVEKVAGLNDAFDKVWQSIGAIGDQLAVTLAPALTDAINSFIELTAEGLKSGGFIKNAMEGIAASINFVAMVARNWSDVWEMVSLSVQQQVLNTQSYLVAFWENLKSFGEYIANNWQKLIIDAFKGLDTVLLNLSKNIGAFIKAAFDFVQGKGFNFEYTGMLEGFKATAAELPDIIKPAFTDISGEIDTVAQRIAAREKKRAEDMAAATAAGPAAAAANLVAADKKKKTTKEPKAFAEAALLGSKEARSAIIKNVGGMPSAEKEALAVQKQQLEALKALQDLQKKALEKYAPPAAPVKLPA